MDALSFFGLRAGDRPGHFRMEVVPRLSSGLGALFGGAGLGAAIEAVEQSTARPLVWATAQYLSYARPPSVLDIDVTEVVRGHQVSQARAVARVGDEEILTVNAALGRRPLELTGSWAVRPDVPPPEECPPRPLQERHRGTILEHLDTRLADARSPDQLDGTPGDGRSALWVRFPDIELTASTLAIVGDYVPFGIGQALGLHAGGSSLDNTIRVVHRVPTVWILADVRIQAITEGFGHGLVHLWADDGSLLATASQSATVRMHRR